MNIDKLRELVGNLIERTKYGDLNWQKIPLSSVLESHIEDMRVRVLPSIGLQRGLLAGSNIRGPAIQILNSAGEIVREIVESDLRLGLMAQLDTSPGLIDELVRTISGSDEPGDEAINKLLKATSRQH